MIKPEYFEFLPLRRYTNPQKEVERVIEKGFKPHQVYPALNQLNASFIAKGSNKTGIKISRTTPVASMGSCFAREIKIALIAHKFNYVQTEHNKWSEHASCSWNRVYSPANALTILKYTDSQKLEELRFCEINKGVIDLYRFKTSYTDLESAKEDVEAHMKASLQAIKLAKVFILTVGQNEIWYNKKNHFYIAQSPPSHVKDDYELKQFSVAENTEMLKKFYQLLKNINPDIQLIITVSPVPSTATYFNENVVIQSLTNKMILRSAVQEFISLHKDVNYFPSFEIVMFSRDWAFMPDNRHVKKEVVGEIMQAFLENFCD